MPVNKEHRRYKRYNVEGCEAQSIKSSLLGLFKKRSPKQMVLNISRDGISFISQVAFAKRQDVKLSITAPFLEGEAIDLQIKVTWAKKLPGVAAFAIGGRFSVLDQIDLHNLKVLLEEAASSKAEAPSYINITATKT